MYSHSDEMRNRADWQSVARRVVAGEFDTPSRGRHPRMRPSGSLLDALVIGLRGQHHVPAVGAALKYLGWELVPSLPTEDAP
jgi:hypothetical protein